MRGDAECSDGTTLIVSGIFDNGYNWQSHFVRCDDGEDAFPFCEYLALGVAPSSMEDTLGLQQALNVQ
jgi:hypothetical protein